MKWSQLAKRIPHKIQVTRKVFYELLWSPEIVGGEDCYGVTRLDSKQIVLLTGQTPRNMVHTYIHEVVHAFSEEYNIGLTETQVRKIESALHYLLKNGNVFKE